MTDTELIELKTLWTKTLGADCPDDSQWFLWGEMRPVEVVRHALLKCAGRARALGGMDTDFKVRYVSSVLIRYDGRPVGGVK